MRPAWRQSVEQAELVEIGGEGPQKCRQVRAIAGWSRCQRQQLLSRELAQAALAEGQPQSLQGGCFADPLADRFGREAAGLKPAGEPVRLSAEQG